MELLYEFINGTEEERKIIDDIIEFINKKYSEKLDLNILKKVEIVDRLENKSSGRSFVDKIVLPRKYGLENVHFKKNFIENIESDSILNMLISTIYHELWHVSTWDKYAIMYEYILSENNVDMCTALAYKYWIEYIAHIETVFMEVFEIMSTFCNNFVHKRWHRMEYGYQYFMIGLPYYLVRSQYLQLYDNLTKKIECEELRKTVYDFDKDSKLLLDNKNINDIEKANIIKERVKKLFNI